MTGSILIKMKDFGVKFDLITGIAMNTSQKEVNKLVTAKSNLRDRLVSMGYEIREEADSINGLPNGILVVGDYGKDPIGDFQSIAINLGLERRYRTGRKYYL